MRVEGAFAPSPSLEDLIQLVGIPPEKLLEVGVCADLLGLGEGQLLRAVLGHGNNQRNNRPNTTI